MMLELYFWIAALCVLLGVCGFFADRISDESYKKVCYFSDCLEELFVGKKEEPTDREMSEGSNARF